MKRGLLLALPLVLAGAALWLLSGSNERGGNVHAGTAPSRPAEVVPGTAAPAAADRNEAGEATRSGTGADAEGSAPIPDDATWVEALVASSTEPVAGATHGLRVVLGKGEKTHRIDDVTPGEVVYGGAGTVQVQVPAAALQRTLERLTK